MHVQTPDKIIVPAADPSSDQLQKIGFANKPSQQQLQPPLQVKTKKKIDADLFDALIGFSDSDSQGSNLTQENTQATTTLTISEIDHNYQREKRMIMSFERSLKVVNHVKANPLELITQEKIFEDYLKRALENGQIKFVKLSSAEPELRAICRFEEEGSQQDEMWQRQTIDCENEMVRSKQMSYFPVNRAVTGGIDQTGISNLTQASQVKLNCICLERRQQITLTYRQFVHIQISCELCEQKDGVSTGMLRSIEIHKILQDNMCPDIINTPDFDKSWTLNMYGQVIWQLLCYQTFFKLPHSLTLHNVLYQLQKKVRKEFIEVKKSFFQKVMQKEQALSGHVVLLVTDIIPTNNPKSRSLTMELSDGSYSMPAYITVGGANDKEDRFDCDKQLMDLSERRLIRPGDKYHFSGLFLFKQGLPGHDQLPEVKTSHYFLQQRHNFHLKINKNGFQKAEQSTRIGQQEVPYFRKSLNKLNQFSKNIPCIDVFVVKKYSPYFLEEIPKIENSHGRYLVRNQRTVDRLRTIRKNQIEQIYERENEKLSKELEKIYGTILFDESEMQAKKDQVRADLEEMKRIKVDCFKMCFRIKVKDALEYATTQNKESLQGQQNTSAIETSYIISFVITNQSMYEAIQEGHRYRFFNVKPECFYRDSYRMNAQTEAILIQFQNGKSYFEDVQQVMKEQSCAQTVALRKKISDMVNYGKSMIRRLIPPLELINTLRIFARQCKNIQAVSIPGPGGASGTDYDSRLRNFKKCNEMTFLAYVVKVVCMPNHSSPIDPDSVHQVILLSSDGDILCLQIHDSNFFIKPSFPSEQSKVICDGIVFQNLMQVEDIEHRIVKEDKYQEYLDSLSQGANTMSDHKTKSFHYITCETSNNSSIDTASHKNLSAAIDQMGKLETILSSSDIKQKLKNIKEIIGDKTQSTGFSSNYDTPQNSRAAYYNSCQLPQGSIGTNMTNRHINDDNLIVTQQGISNNQNLLQAKNGHFNYLRQGFTGVKKVKLREKGSKSATKKPSPKLGGLAQSIAKRNKFTPKKGDAQEIAESQKPKTSSSSDVEVEELESGQAPKDVITISSDKSSLPKKPSAKRSKKKFWTKDGELSDVDESEEKEYFFEPGTDIIKSKESIEID